MTEDGTNTVKRRDKLMYKNKTKKLARLKRRPHLSSTPAAMARKN